MCFHIKILIVYLYFSYIAVKKKRLKKKRRKWLFLLNSFEEIMINELPVYFVFKTLIIQYNKYPFLKKVKNIGQSKFVPRPTYYTPPHLDNIVN